MSTISLVTGASRGLGRSIALCVARQGGDVILTYRENIAAAQDVVDEIHVLGRRAIALRLELGPMSTFASFAESLADKLISGWGRKSFDHLVNNAGHGVMAGISDTSEQQFNHLFDVHVKGVFFLTQRLLPMIADHGRIINISSGLTRVAFPGFSAYASAKGALETMTLYMAKELGYRGITANCIAPGQVDTSSPSGPVPDTSYNQSVIDNVALARIGVPEDIGLAVASLLRPENRWITAQRIEASGGQRI